MDFEVGDALVHPHHGAGKIVRKETRTVLGEDREYLTIHIPHSDLTVSLPSDGPEATGLRHVVSEAEIEELVAVLTGDLTEVPGNWNRRFRHNREKLKSGDIFELAEVIRNLSLRDRGKGLSSGERQMLAKAKRTLASELQYARGTSEDEALEWLDGVLASVEDATVAEPAGLE